VTVELPVGLDTGQVDDRGQHVHRLRAVVTDVALQLTGCLEEQRDPYDLVFVVVNDGRSPDIRRCVAVTMVRGHHQRRVVLARQFTKMVDEFTDESIRRAELRAVELVPEAGSDEVSRATKGWQSTSARTV
jgi:hypothetical protein